MSAVPQVYVSFPGTARAALELYADIFGGTLSLHTYADFGRSDGPPDAIAHGVLDGPVSLGGSDAPAGEPAVRVEGLLLSLLGAAEPAVLHAWFDRLAADGGEVLDPLAAKPWGASDGQVQDRHGLRWLVGYEPQA
ncbi:VOC family protein [Microlunatus capsulatus]|uniref:PhnB protein n=1 Tax=Microlunatus capsulatus TaxID=99117 RepID=A0ABS4Z475_9ACTN|nr:VOC family protein [Microlunatus capsulatus]MBP2415833.1 PhnB protein [Microlunatus capsulatus]